MTSFWLKDADAFFSRLKAPDFLQVEEHPVFFEELRSSRLTSLTTCPILPSRVRRIRIVHQNFEEEKIARWAIFESQKVEECFAFFSRLRSVDPLHVEGYSVVFEELRSSRLTSLTTCLILPFRVRRIRIVHQNFEEEKIARWAIFESQKVEECFAFFSRLRSVDLRLSEII